MTKKKPAISTTQPRTRDPRQGAMMKACGRRRSGGLSKRREDSALGYNQEHNGMILLPGAGVDFMAFGVREC
jgi:hypothetical protein